MIGVGTLLFALLLMSDGTTVRKELSGECNCGDEDSSEECKEQCVSDSVRRARQNDCEERVIPANSVCGRHSNTTYCSDNNAFVGVLINNRCYNSDDQCAWLPCCLEGQCAISHDYMTPASGASPKANNVTFSWSAVYGYLPKLLISWLQPVPVGGYKLFISSTNSTDYDTFVINLDRCSCLNASIRQYSVEVGQFYKAFIQVKLVSLPIYQGIFDDDSHTVTNISRVPDCWELDGAYSEKCVLIPSHPQNLTVTGRLVNQSSIMLHINWTQPAQYNHIIIAYSIEIDTASDELCMYINGSTFHYEVVLNISTYYTVWVSASNSNLETESNEFCYLVNGYDIPSNTYCWGDEASLTVNNSILNITVTPTTTTETQPNMTILVATFSGGGALLLLITMVIMLLVCRTCLYKRSKIYIPLGDVTSLTPSPVMSAKVFIINSSLSNDEDLRLIRNMCHNLAEHSIEPITYEYSMCESGPEQSGIYHWMEDNFNECGMTLFVCNKCFYDAWNGKVTEQDAMVSASKQLLQGHLTSSENISKLAVVLLREHDRQYIPSLYLKNVTTFTVFSDGQCDEENLVRYILQVPRFIRPSVATTLTVLHENTV